MLGEPRGPGRSRRPLRGRCAAPGTGRTLRRWRDRHRGGNESGPTRQSAGDTGRRLGLEPLDDLRLLCGGASDVVGLAIEAAVDRRLACPQRADHPLVQVGVGTAEQVADPRRRRRQGAERRISDGAGGTEDPGDAGFSVWIWRNVNRTSSMRVRARMRSCWICCWPDVRISALRSVVSPCCSTTRREVAARSSATRCKFRSSMALTCTVDSARAAPLKVGELTNARIQFGGSHPAERLERLLIASEQIRVAADGLRGCR